MIVKWLQRLGCRRGSVGVQWRWDIGIQGMYCTYILYGVIAVLGRHVEACWVSKQGLGYGPHDNLASCLYVHADRFFVIVAVVVVDWANSLYI